MPNACINIKEVKNKKDLKIFVNFVLKLYKGSPYYVPMIYQDEMNLLGEKNKYLKSNATQTLFLAYKNGKVVGRIQAIIQLKSNEKFNQRRVRFSRFDCIDDQEVANALFDAASEYGRQQGMTEIVGPLGYSDVEREGLLIEGFDELGTYDEQYNYPYYEKLIENYGFKKEVDWIEFKIQINEETTPKLLTYYEKILKHNKVKMIPKLSHKKLKALYKDDFFDLLNICYKDIYGYIPFDEETKNYVFDSFSIFITHKNWKGMINEDGKLIGFIMWMPSISKALLKSKGNLYNPITLLKLLNAIKHPKVFDLLLCGIHPDYRGKGLDIVYLKEANDIWNKYHLDHFETNLNLESNETILSEWSRFKNIQNKRRRAFVKQL